MPTNRSLKDQGVDDRLPQIHLGVAAAGMIARAAKKETDLQHPRVDRFREIQQFNQRVADLDQEIAEERARLAAEAEKLRLEAKAERQRLEAEAAEAERVRLEAEVKAVAAEKARLEAERQQQTEQREEWGWEIALVAATALKVSGKTAYEGELFHFLLAGGKLTVTAKDGRGVLVQRQGYQLFVSDQITEGDRNYFQLQGQRLAAWQQQLAQEKSKRSKPRQITEDGR